MAVADVSAMRRMNLAATLRELYDHGPSSSAALQRATGLSRRTLEMIVNDLLDRGWIVDEAPDDVGSRSAGRPARRLRFNAGSGFVLAVQLDFGYMNLRVSDLAGTVLLDERAELATELSRDERIARLLNEIDAALARLGASRHQIFAVVVATPGIVRDNGYIDLPVTFLDWSGFPLRQRIAAEFDCEVIVENDAKLAALGEAALAGEGSGANFVWVRADGVRIGLGIVIEGRLYRGRDGAAGEIVWARLLGFEAVESHILSGLVHETHPRHLDARALLARIEQSDPESLTHVETLAAGLAPGLEAIAWILAPQAIVIGGALASIGAPLVEALNRRYRLGTHPIEAEIRTSASSEEAIITGATETGLAVVRRLLFDSGSLPPA